MLDSRDLMEPHMSPRIVAVSGPLKGAAFPISESELSIGRDTESDICLNDPLVSRRHCAISRADETIRVVDLESTNGTWVNGLTVREKELHHNDWVKIGTSQFVFLERDDAAEGPPLFSDDEEYRFAKTRVTTRLGPEDVVYLQPEKLIEKPPASSRVARDLSVLLRVSTSINAIRNAEELQYRLMELIFEVIPAQRIAILLVGQNSLEFTAGTYRVRGSDEVEPFGVSRTATHQVLREGVALMSNDIAGNAGFDGEDNLNSSGLWSVLCVPLTVFEVTLGVIYSDTTGSTATFDADHLQLLTAIASVATVALEHVRYVEWIEGENQRLQEEISLEHDMVGDSHKMRQVYNFINRVSASDSTVLIRGESGTGKELVARAIHRNSRRAAKPFVAVNCAAIVETLLESELFGHERGAFTGAVTQRRGKLETADGGTVFLDEIGELALPLQAALLRVI